MSRSPTVAAAALALALLLPACRSAAGWHDQADQDVEKLVRSRRAKLGIGDGSFTIEPPPDSLRQRLLRGEGSETKPLTLVQCLAIAAENSRDYKTHEEALYIAALDLTLERWNFDVHGLGLFGASVAGEGDTAESVSGNLLSLSKVLGSGAAIVGNIGLDMTRSLTTGGSWSPISTLGLAITQPLLRGAGQSVVLEPLTQSERDLVYAVRDFERYRRTFAFDVASRFYALLEQQDSVKNQEMNFENLQKLSERNAALAEAGRLDDVQAGQARQDELRSRDDLLQARARFELQKDLFKIFLGLPAQVELAYDPVELENLANQDLSPLDLDEERASAFALASRLDHQNTVDQGVDSVRHVFVAEDALRAGLSLGAAITNPSKPGKPGQFDFRDSSWSITAALNLPLDRLVERNSYRLSLIARDVAHRAIEQSADTIRSQLRDEIREVKSKLESWRIQQNAADLAARRIESTDLKLQAGRALTRDLLDAQTALLDARNAVSSALVDYTLSRLALFRDLEMLRVDEKGIEIDKTGLPFANSGASASNSVPGHEAGVGE
jgi:outer membrane protein TolC